ncbi:uncharacterized protein LOC120256715 [Dioscorea cayenensis subsp. rotundata]|uniref:Uncharacterized protein LOC120256715 n=1 Tax=Dioscorea cayennensis subsp. rotundata TaxID=55577 RepID=A0AB40AYT9_DIOCR|nr:uncharacterized protein LOC120256715 [Dioscorea cayenensis subsp. rotundata]
MKKLHPAKPLLKTPPKPPDLNLFSATLPGVSWSKVVSSSSSALAFENPLHLQKPHFDRLKTLSNLASLLIVINGTRPGIQCKLCYTPNFWENLSLLTKLSWLCLMLGRDLAKLLWDGPWTVDGRILQLFEWRESFQPAFEKLSTAAIWIQLHHVPIELWKGEILDVIASHFGRVLKIDEHTLQLSRSKFARICVEIDLDLPLQKGTWVKYGENSVFIIALYEKLPVFCFSCGRVGHGDSNCTFISSRKMATDLQPPTIFPEREMEVDDHCQASGVTPRT